MAGKSRLLWVGEHAVPPNVHQATAGAWELQPYCPRHALAPQLDSTSLAVVYPNGTAEDPRWLRNVLRDLGGAPVVTVFLLPSKARTAWQVLERQRGHFLCIAADATPSELSAKFAVAAELQPAIRHLHAELASARSLGKAAQRQVEELDEEMRLAARLQRDFLPKVLPEVGPVRFGVLFRPAGWVSGDLYDVTRLDERHIGFYVADAVGHGLPAALLTMFIKKALQTKRILGHTYQIVPPNVSLTELNEDICEQNLSNCQFCSAVYCVLETSTLNLSYARAGHPEPLLIRRDGAVEVLSAPGSLLGVFPEERYESRQVNLRPGDRLVIYTDGAEQALGIAPGGPPDQRTRIARAWCGIPRDELLLQLTALFDQSSPPPTGEDDVTVIVVDVED